MADNEFTVALLTHADGAHVTAYLSALKQASACRRVVLADPDGRWAEAARGALGDKLHAVEKDPRAALQRHRPEMALITMEARLAPPLLDAALEARCHVFAEKPSCVRAEDFEPLVRKADSQHRRLLLALANRLNPEIQAARRLIAEGTLGRIYGLEMHLVADQTRLASPAYQRQWFAHKDRAGGGHLIWLGIHWLDLAMYLTGESIKAVSGMIANVGGQPLDVEDSAAASLEFDSGFLGTLTSGYYLSRGYHSHIKIWGAEGWLHLEPQAERPLHWQSNAGPQAGAIQEFRGAKEPRGYTPFVAAAVRACANDEEPPIDSRESLRALQTVFAIYRSAREGRKISVPG